MCLETKNIVSISSYLVTGEKLMALKEKETTLVAFCLVFSAICPMCLFLSLTDYAPLHLSVSYHVYYNLIKQRGTKEPLDEGEKAE